MTKDEIALAYHRQMSIEAREWLYERGFTAEVIETYQLGYVEKPLLVQHEMFTGRISVPYDTPLGGVQFMKYRCIRTTGAKYLSDLGEPNRLYNTKALDRADKLGYVAIVEGETDTWTLDTLCKIPAVGMPGSKSWTQHKEWPPMFEGYETVFVPYDRDESGRAVRDEICEKLRNAVPVELPCKDSAETFEKLGREGIIHAFGL